MAGMQPTSYLTFARPHLEVSETALKCDGAADVLTAGINASTAAAAAKFQAVFMPGFATSGYTMFAWVKPASAKAGTVMSFQSPAPGLLREAEIVYDGARFVYYDDNILAAAAPAAAPPGEWHYVAVSVAADGEGILVVDGAAAVDFSTRSRPSGGSLTVCARLTGASSATSHFAGEIDEVRVFAKPMTQEMIAAGAFSPNVAGEAGLVSLLNFTYGYDAHPALGLAVSGAPGRVASTGPWRAPLIASLSPKYGAPSGGEKITVSAANLAPSQWLKLDVGVGVDIAPTAGSVNGSTAVVVTPLQAAGACTVPVGPA